MTPATSLRVAPAPDGDDGFLEAVVSGLGRPKKAIPCTYFYDRTGAALFTRICAQPEYYPTRTETAILDRHARSIAGRLPAGAVLVEFGAGSSGKADILIAALDRPAAYVPIDVSASCLAAAVRRLAQRFPRLPVLPVAADFTQPLALPPALVPGASRIGFFPGSTIGNFHRGEAAGLLRRFIATLGPGSRLLLGVDLKKDPGLLHAAYNDRAGVTAAFNLNLLVRANRELGADFALDGFVHRAVYNRALGRIEMHLISVRRQAVRLAGHVFRFTAGESIHTENSYKYDAGDVAALAAAAGLDVAGTWTDERRLFAVHLLVAAAAGGESVRPR
jgi:dimethylhistidine N-methyltransferase